MFLFDVVAFNAENTASLKVARRLTQTIRAMKMNVAGLGGDFDVFIAMTYVPNPFTKVESADQIDGRSSPRS